MRIETPIETDRLRLRLYVAADFDELYAMHTDPDVMRFVGGPLPWSREKAMEHQRQIVAEQNSREYGPLAVVKKATGQFIGWIELLPQGEADDIQLGIRLARHAWGKGYATEGCKALLEAGVQQLGLRRVIATVHPENAAMIRVLAKLGFTYTSDFFHEKAQCTAQVYALERSNRATGPNAQASSAV